MLARHSLLAVLTALAAGLAACGDARPLQVTAGGGGGLCVSCHGGTDNTTGAPPRDLSGSTPTTARGVGAHSAHVVAGPLAGAFGCAECHEPVAALDSPGHNDGTLDLPFGDLAKTGGVIPAWNPGAAGGPSCSSVYCHGNFPGGNVAAPVWTKVGQGEADCGTCHGTPPTSNHPSIGALTCDACHSGTVKLDGSIDVPGGLHVNGAVDFQVHRDPSWVTAGGGNHAAAALDQATPFQSCLECHQNFGSAFGVAGSSCNDCHQQAATAGGWATTNWQQNCVFCHGDQSTIATWTGSSPAYQVAPPRGALGETLTTEVAVGAHQKHVNPAANLLSSAIACIQCHPSPLPADIGHVDGVADLPLSGPLTTTPTGTFTPSPSWNAGTRGCAATYCHGNYPQGGNNATPVWTTVDGSFAGCNSCHGAPPDTGEHLFHMFVQNLLQPFDCKYCHNGIATGSGGAAPVDGTIVSTSLHVNGVRDVAFFINPGIATWTPAPTAQNAAAGSCSNVACHGTRDW